MSLILQYDFSVVNGVKNIAKIANPSQYDGFLYNNPTIGTIGNTSQTTSITFNKSLNQYIEIPPIITPIDGLTFSFWFISNGDNTNARLFDFANSGPSDNISIYFTGNGLTFNIQNGINSYSNNINISNLNNIWYYIVWTLSPNPNIWNIYINGNLVNTFTSNIFYPNAISRNLQYIGMSNYSNIPYFNGSISDFSIYFGPVLIQNQITNIYTKDSAITKNVYNELYNNIYCDLQPSDNGFIKCTNCNYGEQIVSNTSSQKSEHDCLKLCDKTQQCTSYNYNILDNTCILNSSFPTHIEKNINNINSGYSISKFGYDYTNLNNAQKEVVKQKCATQYLNNHFLLGSNIDLSPCLTINTSNSTDPTTFSAEPSCIYNIFTKNNIKTAPINNNNTYTETNISPTSDTTIDNYKSLYKNYIDNQVAVTNLNGNNNSENTLLNNIAPKIIEAYENKYCNKFILIFLLIIIIFIFIYYIWKN